MADLYGDQGRAWLRALPDLLTAYARRWRLTLLSPFPNLTYNFVAPAERTDGTAVVLKAGVVNSELLNEIAALRHFAGCGAVRLLEADPDQGVFLLERLNSGRSLVTLADDDQATRIAAQVMLGLWQKVEEHGHFPTTADWAGGLARLRQTFAGSTGPFNRRLVTMAETLFAELLASAAAPVLLHGDLHHDNVLANGEGWLAIDPKGVVGEPAYEVGALLRNFWGRDVTADVRQKMTARRVAILQEMLGIAPQRILGWGLAQAVLSGWWSYEDHGHGWEEAMVVAEMLAAMMG